MRAHPRFGELARYSESWLVEAGRHALVQGDVNVETWLNAAANPSETPTQRSSDPSLVAESRPTPLPSAADHFGHRATPEPYEAAKKLRVGPITLGRWEVIAILAVIALILVIGLTTVIAGRGDSNQHASTQVVVAPPSAAQLCATKWNGSTDSFSTTSKQMVRAISQTGGQATTLYVSAGFSADFPDRCLVTVANPDVGNVVQFTETSQGGFRLSGTGRVSDVPDSAKQWNATMTSDGVMLAGF